jgi:hypothetical protein
MNREMNNGRTTKIDLSGIHNYGRHEDCKKPDGGTVYATTRTAN